MLARERFPEYTQVVAVRLTADGCDGCRSSTTSRCTQLYIFCKSITFAKSITSRVIDLSQVHCIFKTGLYPRQAYVQCCILRTVTRSHTAHKFVHNAPYTIRIFCVGCTTVAYIQGRLIWSTAHQKGRLLFKTGLFSRVAVIRDFAVGGCNFLSSLVLCRTGQSKLAALHPVGFPIWLFCLTLLPWKKRLHDRPL